MEISQKRFELALRELRESDWQRFERLSSTFLASEWPNLRTMAEPSGDGGRDSELFSPTGVANVVIQYSIQKDWASKIRLTAKRLTETFPDANILVFLSNQEIGAKSDSLKRELSSRGMFLDVRDRSWFIERANLDSNRIAAATELSRVIVDPLLETKGILTQSVSALSGDEAKIALMFLEMQWRNEIAGKGLTKSAFEALVRGALHGTDSSKRLSRTDIHDRVSKFLPQHPPDQLAPFIDAALRRLTKTAVRHRVKEDEFNLSHEETERLKDEAAAIRLFKDVFNVDVSDIIDDLGGISNENKIIITDLAHKIIESYFMKRGEEFAASLAQDTEPPVNETDLRSIAISVSPKESLVPNRQNVDLLLHVVITQLANPSDAAKEYLRILSDSYTLFAFLEQVPDVQKVTKKLFTQGTLWLDTSVLLPIFAEQAFPEAYRPFTTLFLQAKIAGTRLGVTAGILEEIERHINLCVAFTRSDNWEGRVPYIYARYALAGRSPSGFSSWVEQFQGPQQPVQDIADYLSEFFGIEVWTPTISQDLDESIVSSIRDYWKDIQDRRRPISKDYFNMNANRLAEHDSENCISVISERQIEKGRAPLGFTSWLLTLDSAARNMVPKLDRQNSRKIGRSPVISIDFLLKYLAFGPSRDRVDHSVRGLPYAFAGPILESLPQDLIEVARRIRSESGELPERIIQRRIRDALDREKMKAGPVQIAGLDGASQAINEMF